jgi:hypothetical protein
MWRKDYYSFVQKPAAVAESKSSKKIAVRGKIFS